MSEDKTYYMETPPEFNVKTARLMTNNVIKKLIDDDFSKNISKIANSGGTTYTRKFSNSLDIMECINYIQALGFNIIKIKGVDYGVDITISW